jgi:hypothetical protein
MLKHIFLTLTLILLIGVQTSCAATVTFAWDEKPVTEVWTFVRIYERVGTDDSYTYVKVAEVSGNVTQASALGVSAGVHTYFARSVFVNGTVEIESFDSNVVTTTVRPGTPTNLKFIIP